jgi:hypothetical protein
MRFIKGFRTLLIVLCFGIVAVSNATALTWNKTSSMWQCQFTDDNKDSHSYDLLTFVNNENAALDRLYNKMYVPVNKNTGVSLSKSDISKLVDEVACQRETCRAKSVEKIQLATIEKELKVWLNRVSMPEKVFDKLYQEELRGSVDSIYWDNNLSCWIVKGLDKDLLYVCRNKNLSRKMAEELQQDISQLLQKYFSNAVSSSPYHQLNLAQKILNEKLNVPKKKPSLYSWYARHCAKPVAVVLITFSLALYAYSKLFS